MKKVVLALNPMEPETWTTHEVVDVREFLMGQFEEWPSTARIYHEHVSSANDVTPSNEAEVDRLGALDGTFYVIVYPADPVTIVIAVVAIVVIAAVVLQPTIPTPTLRNTQNQSPNNELSERANKSRPLKRIPDIFGTVRSTPDLIAVPYKIFQDHEEVEYTYMCIGRGAYDVSDVRDDTTLAADIAGTSVEVYAPNTSPNSGHAPQLRIGQAINTPLLDVVRSNAVNGQVLRAPNDMNIVGVNNIYFASPNEIRTSAFDFTDKFAAGDSLTVTGATFNRGNELYNLNGTYNVLSVANDTIRLSNPTAVNSNWSTLTTSPNLSPILSTTGPKWVGPFVLDKKDTTQIFCNFVALNGLYKDDGQNQVRMDVTLELEVTPINADGSPRGAVQTFQATVEGSATSRSTRAVTLKATSALSGRLSIRARRVTPSDLAFKGSVVDEIKWRDVYAVAPVAPAHFGNVTTVQSVTYATAGALSLKERKLNMLVTRKIPVRVSGSTFSTNLYATNRADHILSAVCLDPHIGNRPASEIDFDAIYTALEDVRSYFGNDVAGEFNYTFDSDNLSFEETAQSIANAVFCTAYRRGNIIKLNFERETEDSTLLFNHRNKLPGSETRTIRFGNQSNFDGVSYQYIDPDDDALVTYYIPQDRSAINPKEIESIGVRSKLQAHFHAWRAWNKIRYQNVITEFEATQEADLLVPQDRILVADNTRSGIQDGEVRGQTVLEIELSQPVVMQTGINYNIFLQLCDGTVESMPITAGRTNRHVVLSRAPRIPLAIDDGLYARAGYIIVGDDEPRENAFLLVEKNPQSNFTSTVKAVNYDARYYSADKDYVNGVVNSNGDYL